jgi:Raf kinase inhibitor-like YbhB/YbcL family protein
MTIALVLSLVVQSAAFSDGRPIPKQFTCDGSDQSPRVDIGEMPPSAVTWALIVDDPDAPGGTFVHWAIWNLPAKLHGVGPDVPAVRVDAPDGSRQGKNGFGKLGWGGPCPPKGKPHHYRFRAFALDGKLTLAAGASAEDVERAMKGHVLAEGTLVGTYQR